MAKQAFNQKVVNYIGEGATRVAYMLEDGKIVKFVHTSSWAGEPDNMKFMTLLNKYKYTDKKVAKIAKDLEAGFVLPSGHDGIVMEYLMSLFIVEYTTYSKFFALCLDIMPRRNNKNDTIEVKGLYENAMMKSDPGRNRIEGFSIYQIRDLHYMNYVNNIIVDYACVY